MKQKTIHLARAAMTLLLVMLCSIGVWAEQKSVSLGGNASDGWFINMPANGTATSVANAAVLTLTADDISAGKGTFKIYDDGGKDGNYSHSYYGYLIITLPEGFIPQVSGSINTESCCDYLQVFDGTSTSTQLGEPYYKGEKTIAPLRSHSRSIMLHFYSDGSVARTGFELTLESLDAHNLEYAQFSWQEFLPYTGSPIALNPTVTAGDNVVLTQDTHYTVTTSPSPVQEIGNYEMTITGIAPYYGTLNANFAVTTNLEGDGTEAHPYLISNITDYNLFVSYINAGTAPYADNGKIYKLTADIGTDLEPVTAMVGSVTGSTQVKAFSGILDGDGHTLTVGLSDTGNQGVAPFRYISTATIKNLTVAGTISSNSYHTSGLVGFAAGTNLIENCTVTATLNISSDYAGGIIGHGLESVTTIKDCVFAGTIVGVSSSRNRIGGIWGWSDTATPTLQNCLEKGTYSNINSLHPMGLQGNSGTITDCYYLNAQKNSPLNACTVSGAYRVYTAQPDGMITKYQQLVDGNNYYIDGNATITGVNDTYDYNGSAIAISYTLNFKDAALTAATDYTATITDSNSQDVTGNVTAIGRYTLTFTGTGDYRGTQTKDFTVVGLLSGEGTSESPYLINNNDDWGIFATNVTNGMTYAGKYVQMAGDITVTTMAGSSQTNSFQGTFLGTAGKTMTLNLTGTADNCAPFGYLKGATIKDLTVAGTVTTGFKYGASIAAHTYGDTHIQNCVSTVEITSTFEESADGIHGGFVARNEGSAYLYFNDCVFAGKLLGANAYANGGFVGYSGGYYIYYTDCLFAPSEITMSTSNSCTFNRNGSNSFTRTYYLTQYGNAQGLAVTTTPPADNVYTAVTAADAKTYYAACTITGLDDIYSNTGSAIAVTPVVKLGNTTLTKDTDYTVTFKSSSDEDVAPEALIDNGNYTITITGIGNYAGSQTFAFQILTGENIGGYFFETGTDGEGTYYKIATATDFDNLAACVNGTDNVTAGKRFKQTANITVSSMIGTGQNKSFQGVYDGQGNTLTLDITATQNIAGPFRYIKGATIKNITIAGAINNSGKQNGGVAGYSYDDVTIANCTVSTSITSGFNGDASNGGFIAHIQSGNVTFNNCVFTGRLLGESASHSAGFVGWRDNTNIVITFNNCLFAPAEITMGATGSASFNRNKTDNNIYTNSYYLTSYGEAQGAKVVTAAPASGVYKAVVAADANNYYTLCDITGVESVYLHTGSAIAVEPVVKMGSETLTAATDYTVTIKNSSDETVAADALIDNGSYTMTVAGIGSYTGSEIFNFRVFDGENLDGYVFETATDDEGSYYVIADESDLELLSAYVNSGHNASGKRFKQTANITLTEEHTPIGNNNSSKQFCGTYDGGNNTISGLVINNPNGEYQGLFGYINSATIKNVVLDNCDITARKWVGGIVGYANNSSHISHCTVSGALTTAAGVEGFDQGGIVGYGNYVDNCVNLASVTGNGTSSICYGGIAGYTTNTISNCFNLGAVTGGTSNVGSIVGEKGGTLSNNYRHVSTTGGVGVQNVTTAKDQSGIVAVFAITVGNAETHLTTEPEFEYNGLRYYKNSIELALSYDLPDGKVFDQYAVTNATLSNAYVIDATHILTNATDDVTITGSHTDKINLASGATTVHVGVIPYTGNVVNVAPIVERLGVTLVQGTDYTFTTAPAVVQTIGEYTLTVTGQGEYMGTKQVTFYVKEPTLIRNAEEWATFAANINAGTGNDDYYKLADDFDNTESAVTATVGTQEHPFTGLLDGNGKTLTVNINETSTQGTAPFREIAGATIKNLTVNGSVTGTTHAAGLVGFARSGVNYIDNCVVNTNVTGSTGSSRHIGGVVGHGIQSTVNISNTVYTGTLSNNTYAGGLLGWSDGSNLNITHCLVTGSKNGSNFHPIAIKNNTAEMKSVNVDDVFYTHDATLTDDNYIAATGTKVYESAQEAFCKKRWTLNEKDYYSKETAVIGNVDDLIEYTGSAITLAPTVTCEGNALTADTEFTFATDPVTVQEKGEYTLNVTGQGNYAGTQSMKFHVVGGVLDGEGTEVSPYLIANAEDWNKFAGNINSGDYNYSGKFVQMADDMTVSTMAGNSEANSFQGTFLGTAGKTMTLNLTATADGCAPFGYLKNATIKDLTIAGTISTGFKYAGSIAAHNYGTTHIQNCISTAEITSTFGESADATHGGFVALNEGSAKLYFNNCVFAGKLLGANATSNGGFLGWNGGSTINYTDCLFAPAEITMSTSSSATFNRNGNNSFTRAYYLTQYGDAQGVYVVTTAPANDVYTTVEATDAKTYYAPCDITGLNDFYSYTGNAVAVTPVVKLGSNTTLTKGTDYTVTIKNSSDVVVDPEELKELGNYTITIEGAGNYTGSRTIAFKIVTTENIGGYVFETGTDDEGKYYKVATATDFENLKACVNSADNTTASTRFKQTANITVSSMMGTSENRSFQGIYDGQGNTLTLDITASQNIAGPFRYIKGATIKNITIAGAINNSGKQNGGVAGYSYGDVTISNCTVSTSITSSFNGDASNGGFIARIQTGSATFNDCVFTGRLLGESANCSAGFVGWRGNTNIPITFNNCLFAPAEVTMSAIGSATFNRNKTDNNTYTNSYYLTSYGEAQGTQVVTATPASGFYKAVVAADANNYYALCDIGVESVYLRTGSAIAVEPVVKLGSETLTAATDYTVTFKNSSDETVAADALIDYGNYTVTVAGTGSCAGTEAFNFRIVDGEDLDGYAFETATDDAGTFYVIADESDLERLGAYVNSGHNASGKRFKQTANIILTEEHTPIGNSSNKFYGTYDGDNKTISGLVINHPNGDYQGLFGYINSATIRNVVLEGVDITARQYVGGVAGYAYDSHIYTSSVSGAIKAADGVDSYYHGGIVGYIQWYRIEGCVNTATVTGNGTNSQIFGGIAGYVYSTTVKDCFNAGEVTGTSYVGSVIGQFYSGTLTDNYYPAALGLTGGVGAQNVATGTDQAGAEIAFTITAGENTQVTLPETPAKVYNEKNYYKNGTEVTLNYNTPAGKFFDQYTVSNGTITYPYVIDGKHLLTGVTDNVTITGSHTDKIDVASNAVTVCCGIIPYTGNAITVAPVVERLGVTLVQGTDYEVSTTPAVVQDAGEYTLTITGKGNYTGTKNVTFYVKNATLIKNAEEWATFAENVNNGTGNDGYYKLADDFDNSTAVTATVGTGEHPFTGLFDGNGKTLTVNINETSTQGTAPFREIAGATIKNLTVSGDVMGTTHAAGLVGFARSGVNFIDNCVVNTNVTCSTNGNKHIGGVVGHGIQSTVNISNTIYAGVLTNSDHYAGGLLGWSDGGKLNITHCLVTGSKSGNGKFHPIAVKNNTTVMEVNVNGAFYTHDATLTDVNYIAATGTKVYVGAQEAFCKKEYTLGETDYYSKESVVISNVDNTIEYTGDEITLAPTVTYEGNALTADTEFTFATDPATVQEKGEYTLTVTGQGIYAGTQSMKFHVVGGVLDGEGTKASPYLIATVADWNKFAGNINSGTYNYSGQFVQMTEDMTVSTMAGNSEANSFQGTFLGTAGKTMTLALTGTADGCAPFGYLKNATIKNLTVAGTVTTGFKYGASIAAHNYGNTYIQNCVSTVEITSTYETSTAGTHAGFVARNEGSAHLYFNDCVFAGKLLGANATGNGGFVGYNSGYTIYYTDCLFAPAEITMSTSNSCTFNRNGTNSFTRAYYLTAFGTTQSIIAYTSENVPATGLFGQITAADGKTYYVQGSVSNIDDSYAYTGSAISINPTFSISNESVDFVKDTDFEVTITKDGNPVAEVKEFGDYVFTISGKDGGKCKSSYTKNVNVNAAKPTDFAWSVVTASIATLTWTDNVATNWTVEISEDNEFSTIIESKDVNDKTVTFDGLTADVDYYARVKAVYDEVSSDWSPTSFQTSSKVIVGSGTDMSGTLPTNIYYKYSLAEQIYTKTEMGHSGAILSIDFYCNSAKTRNMDLYMVNTEKSSFDATNDWIDVSSAGVVKVFSGEVAFKGNRWTTITLSTPFDYDNTKNLAIIVDDNSGNWTNGYSFRSFNGGENRSLCISSDGTNYNPIAPTYSGTVSSSKNQLRIRMADKITMNTHGIMTYASDNVLDFSNVSDLTAHYASSFTTNHDNTGVLTMTQAEKTPAGEGLMLRGTANETFYVPVLCGINPTISNNLMVGLTTATNVATTDGGYTNYILSKQNDVIGWYPLATAYTLKAHSAYLKLLTADVNAARGITMEFEDGETTGIATITNDRESMADDAWYTVDGKKLDGQPVKKGLYIHNGRKTVIK